MGFNLNIMGITRLKNYDYGSDGWYFITICTVKRKHFFGELTRGEGAQDLEEGAQNLAHPHLHPSTMGEIAHLYWTEIPNHFPFVILDEFVIMPDHMHGLFYFDKPDYPYRIPRPNQFGPQSKNLASVIRGYKAAVKKYATMNNIPFAWQSRYHDYVIRTENRLQIIRRYIRHNPYKWFEKKRLAKLSA